MAKKITQIKVKKEPKFSEVKNEQSPIKITEEELPETKMMIKIDKMDMPLATVEEATAMWKQYQDLMAALMKESDIVEIQGKRRVKKSGVNKIARFFGYSCEIIRTKREDIVGPQGGKQFVWYAWVKAIAPNGRFRVEGAACSSTERRFAHLYHDVFAMAITRASNRAIQELAGMGELELDEEDINSGQKKAPEDNQSDKIGQENEVQENKWAIDDKEEKPKTLERQTANSDVKEVGINPDRWQPMTKKTYGLPTNSKMEASPAQMNLISEALKRVGLVPEDVVFILNNRADGIVREKYLIDLDKGDAFDLIELIKQGKEALLGVIKK